MSPENSVVAVTLLVLIAFMLLMVWVHKEDPYDKDDDGWGDND